MINLHLQYIVPICIVVWQSNMLEPIIFQPYIKIMITIKASSQSFIIQATSMEMASKRFLRFLSISYLEIRLSLPNAISLT